MFQLNEKYSDNRDILKCDYIRYSPSEISTKKYCQFTSIYNYT